MPKLTYTTKKGLVTAAGTGVDLTDTSSDVSTRRKVIALTNASTTVRALLATESGSLVTLNASTNTATTITVGLPAATKCAGCWFEFAITADAGNAGADVSITTGDDDIDIIGAIIAGEDSNTNLVTIGGSKITFDAGETAGQTLGGTFLSIHSDGADWYVKRFVTPSDVTTAHIGSSSKAIIVAAAA